MVHPSSLRIPRVRRYSGFCTVPFRFHLRGSHTLRRAFPDASVNSEILFAVRTPVVLLLPVWPLPRSLATTCGISFDFSSSGYLDVSVPRVPHAYLWIQHAFHGSSPWGFPHSEIRGSKLICSSPRLIAACHVLHRLPMPRHSPYALLCLNYLPNSFLFSWFSLRLNCCVHTCSSFGKIVSFTLRKNLIFSEAPVSLRSRFPSCFPYMSVMYVTFILSNSYDLSLIRFSMSSSTLVGFDRYSIPSPV